MTFGLSMDYEIFLLTRIRERFLQTCDTRDAVAYGVSTSARTITSAALIMIAVFIGFAFAGMPLVAQLGVACAVAIAVDATIVRLVLVPALMAVFDEWNWWLPARLERILPAIDFDKPLPKLDLGGLVVLPDDLAAAPPPAADLRMVLKSASRLRQMAPDAVCVADPLALRGCAEFTSGPVRGGDGLHPVTVWRGRLAVALDALVTDAATARRSPVETTNVQLPSGDRLQIPTGAETLRLKSYLVLCRNNYSDYAELAALSGAMGLGNAAMVLADIDRYYVSGQPQRQWIATQLIRRLGDPSPSGPDRPDQEWENVRQRCLALAVAMLEEPS